MGGETGWKWMFEWVGRGKWKWMFEWVGRGGGNGCLSGWGERV